MSSALNLQTQIFEQAYQRATLIRFQYQVSEDRSPVMQSPHVFAAKIEHDNKRIVLNGFLIDQSPDPDVLRAQLEWHELFHAVFRENSDQAQVWLKELAQVGLPHDEEQVCDLLSDFAMSRTSYLGHA